MIKPRSRQLAAPDGFTLIELMLAVAILGIILVMLASSFHAVAASKVQAENRLAVDQQARSILWQLSNEIRGAVQTPLIASRVLMMGEAKMRNAMPEDTITISTLDPAHRRAIEGFGAEDTVAYYTTPNPKRQKCFLLTRQQSSSLLGIGTGGNANSPVIIADNLLALHIRYFDGTQWSESWNSQQLPPGRELPIEISIDLSMAAANGVPFELSTVVSLPMAIQQW